MRFCFISDLHGTLPKIEPCYVLCICGDITDLSVQRSFIWSETWLYEDFFRWVKGLPCNKVLFIAGNHDYYLEYQRKNKIDKKIENFDLSDKLIYLEDTLYTFDNGMTVYGCPWCISPMGWAFIDSTGKVYDKIPDCDILLTHQPPKIGKISCSWPDTAYERDFGSDKLYKVINGKDIKYSFCGHIHSGDHNLTTSETNNTKFYNVSIKNEDYEPVYPPLYLEIEKDDK